MTSAPEEGELRPRSTHLVLPPEWQRAERVVMPRRSWPGSLTLFQSVSCNGCTCASKPASPNCPAHPAWDSGCSRACGHIPPAAITAIAVGCAGEDRPHQGARGPRKGHSWKGIPPLRGIPGFLGKIRRETQVLWNDFE